MTETDILLVNRWISLLCLYTGTKMVVPCHGLFELQQQLEPFSTSCQLSTLKCLVYEGFIYNRTQKSPQLGRCKVIGHQSKCVFRGWLSHRVSRVDW